MTLNRNALYMLIGALVVVVVGLGITSITRNPSPTASK